MLELLDGFSVEVILLELLDGFDSVASKSLLASKDFLLGLTGGLDDDDDKSGALLRGLTGTRICMAAALKLDDSDERAPIVFLG